MRHYILCTDVTCQYETYQSDVGHLSHWSDIVDWFNWMLIVKKHAKVNENNEEKKKAVKTTVHEHEWVTFPSAAKP